MFEVDSPSRLAIFALLAASLLTGGCDNSFSPFSERGAYSVYGALSLDATIQFVRVKPLDTPIVDDTSDALNVSVTLEDLSNGSTHTLRDSTITFGEEDIVTHNFWAQKRMHPDTRYRLVIEDANGVLTKATATTPTGTDALPIPKEGHCLTSFTVLFREASVPFEASVGFAYDGVTFWDSQQRSFSLAGRNEKGIRFTPEAILSSVIPSVDNPETPFQYEPRCQRLDTREVRVAYTYLGEDWFGDVPESGTEFDPTDSDRIENGLGFFGAFRRDTLSVAVDTCGTIDLR